MPRSLKTSFQQAVADMSVAALSEVADLFKEISDSGEPWHFVAPNIQMKEHFLKKNTMRQLIELFRAKRADIPPKDAYLQFCYTHPRAGGPAKSLGTTLGCVKEKSLFINYLWRTNHLFRSPAQAEDFVDRLIRGGVTLTSEKRIPLSSHGIWCTWGLTGDNPFHFARTNDPDELRAFLGLPPRPTDRLLLFRYPRAAVTGVYRPTVLDAALHPFFSPPSLAEDRFGETLPWHESHLPAILRASAVRLTRLPEAIHLPVPVEKLSSVELR